jgi:hypothetical protein
VAGGAEIAGTGGRAGVRAGGHAALRGTIASVLIIRARQLHSRSSITPPACPRTSRPACPACLPQDPSWPVVITLFETVSSPDFYPIANGQITKVSAAAAVHGQKVLVRQQFAHMPGCPPARRLPACNHGPPSLPPPCWCLPPCCPAASSSCAGCRPGLQRHLRRHQRVRSVSATQPVQPAPTAMQPESTGGGGGGLLPACMLRLRQGAA